MADTTREVIHEQGGGASAFISWLALILAILALVLAWLAYNRAGEDLETRIEDQVNESVNDLQQETGDQQ